MKIVTIIGARPQFIKASVLSIELIKNNIQEVIVHTGQHFDPNMSDIFFNQMDIPRPQYILDINGLNHGAMTGRMLEQIETILLNESPDFVLVYGDTNSTLAGSLAAKKLHIKVIYIEAGLRSFNMNMPEEINRILTDRISNYLFCPTDAAIDNLHKEGFARFNCKVESVGDVMYDCFLHFKSKQQKPEFLENTATPFILATIHRAENTDDINNLTNIVKFFNDLHRDGYNVILPIHPRTRNIIANTGLKLDFMVVEPVGYLEMLWLLNNCAAVITDSGGMQKEAYFAKKKCLTLRTETEWVELVNIGWNTLINPQQAIQIVDKNFITPKKYINFYGNGDACSKIVAILLLDFNNKKKVITCVE